MAQGLPGAVGNIAQQGVAGNIAALANQRLVVNSQVYMSRGWFIPTRTGAGPFTFTVSKGTEISLFQYKKGDQISGVVGAPAGYVATFADTTLQQPGQTINGQLCLIMGLSFLINPGSDFGLAQALLPELSVAMGLNGSNQQDQFGTPLNLPNIGGLYGAGPTGLLAPATNANQLSIPFASNGNPLHSNFRDIPEGKWWRPTGDADSNLVITLRAERDVVITSSAARAADLAVGITEYTPPEAGAVYLDLMCHLITGTLAQSSVNT